MCDGFFIPKYIFEDAFQGRAAVCAESARGGIVKRKVFLDLLGVYGRMCLDRVVLKQGSLCWQCWDINLRKVMNCDGVPLVSWVSEFVCEASLSR